MRICKLVLYVGILFTALGSSVWSEEQALPPREIRFLAVGETPPFRQEIRDGVRYELKPKAGSLPPRLVELSVEGKILGELQLTLSRPSKKIEVPGKEVTLLLSAEGNPWHRFTLPEGGDYMLVLWRSPREGSWEKAFSRRVKDGEQFGEGMLRLLNVSPAEITLTLEGRKQSVAPGESLFEPLGITAGKAAALAYRGGKSGWRRLWSSALVQNAGERNTMVVYKADGEKPRTPLKLLSIREKVNAIQPEIPKAKP